MRRSYSLSMSNFIRFSIFCACCKDFTLLNTFSNHILYLIFWKFCLMFGEPSPAINASLIAASLHCDAATSRKLQSLLNIFGLCRKSSRDYLVLACIKTMSGINFIYWFGMSTFQLVQSIGICCTFGDIRINICANEVIN